MNAKGEQALVGLFVMVAALVLIGTVFTISVWPPSGWA